MLVFRKILLFNIILISFLTAAQDHLTAPQLKTKISNNSKLYKNNIDEAYKELNGLLKQSIILKDSISEMKLLDRKCRYFYGKNMMDSLIITSENLRKKSSLYKDIYFEAMSNIYIAEIYSINKFPDKNQPREALKKIYEEIESGKMLKDKNEQANFQYLNYANLANIYIQINSDSAYHYAKKSILIKPSDVIDDKSMIDNYSVIGKVYKDKKDYKNSIKNFHKALFISNKNGTELNNNQIYHSLKDIYDILNNKDSANFYSNKIEQYELKSLKSKYNSLQEVISKDKKEQENAQNPIWYWIMPAISAIVCGAFLTIKRKKSKVEPEIKPEIDRRETYHHLMELLEKKDPAFLFTFEKVYPEFSNQLLIKNPDLQQSEIEFCALLKMKLSTKDIARISFIETRTVQNKKYRIRKKLDIPQNVDIYQWIDQI